MIKTYEQGMMEIMAIIDGEGHGEKIGGAVGCGAHVQPTINSTEPIFQVESPIKPVGKIAPKELVTVYDGQGHTVSVNGVNAHTGYIKGKKRAGATAKDALRASLLDTLDVIVSENEVFAGKTGRNKVEGLVVRMADADYTIKVAGHAKLEFSDRDDSFKPEINYLTRGKEANHTSALSKFIVGEFENEKLKSIFGNQNLVTLLQAKASGIRFEIQDSKGLKAEYTIKLTKKRGRVVMD